MVFFSHLRTLLPMRRVASTVLALSLTGLVSGAAQAQVTPIAAPFIGTAQESFESFPRFEIVSPFAILGGIADVTGTENYIYQPGDWGLGNNGDAQVADGIQGLGLNNGGASNDGGILFDTSATQFGAFFGNVQFGRVGSMTIRFFDAADTEFFSESWNDITGDGTLTWHGWNSTIAIKRIAIQGESPAVDSIRVTISGNGGAAAPEPGTLALLAFGVAGGLALRRRK